MMQELIYCKKCVISNYRPSSVIEFKSKQNDTKPYIAFKMVFVQNVFFMKLMNQ